MADAPRTRFPLFELAAVMLVAVTVVAVCIWLQLIPVQNETWVDLNSARLEQRKQTLGICVAVRAPPELNYISSRLKQRLQSKSVKPNWVLTSVESSWLGSTDLRQTEDYNCERVLNTLGGLCYTGRYYSNISHAPDVEFQLSADAMEELTSQVVLLLDDGIDWPRLSGYVDATYDHFELAVDHYPQSDTSANETWHVQVKSELVIPAEKWLADPVPAHYFDPDKFR